jgi:hypothetical protein
MENILFCMYMGIPEPPTLNALNTLSSHSTNIVFLRSNIYFKGWDYASNIQVIETSSCIENKAVMRLSFLSKIYRFTTYCSTLYKQLVIKKYDMLVIHDYLGLLAYWCVNKIVRFKGLVWFNSYDPLEPERYNIKPYSLLGILKNNLADIFTEIDYLSIPAQARLPYYPVENIRRKYFVLPNFPAKSFYQPFFEPKKLLQNEPIRILYQGAIGEGHGIEFLITVLKNQVKGRTLNLLLKGWIYKEYEDKLYQLAEKEGVRHLLFFEGYSWYKDLPAFTRTCTVGWAVHADEDNIAFKTAATASNKIYEYAALGMPVFLYDSENYRTNLDKYAWTFFSNLTEQNLLDQMTLIIDNYENLSIQAHKDFLDSLNYENAFNPIIKEIYQDYGKTIHS